MKDHTRISLWSGPRNISTTLMYSFAQRKDTQVYDEPLYGYYLEHTDADDYHPGADDILRTMEVDGNEVIAAMVKDTSAPVTFNKNMAHHLLDLDRSFMKDLVNVLLTRDPKEMIPSFAKVIENPTIDDIGYKAHVELIDDLESMGIEPIVIESKRILLDPEGQLKALCDRIGIPFDDAMLTWEEGPRLEDGVWAEYWYDNVHRSTGFKPYKEKTEPFPKHLEPLLEECRPFYERLIERAL